MFTPSVYEPEKDYTWILKQHLDAARNGRREAQSIMAANPKGRSGILVDTHNGDTSMDSTPLAYKMATRLGKRFRTLTPPFGNSIVYSNDFGYNNALRRNGPRMVYVRTLRGICSISAFYKAAKQRKIHTPLFVSRLSSHIAFCNTSLFCSTGFKCY